MTPRPAAAGTRGAAVEEGMLTIRRYGAGQVVAGRTSLEEVLWVTPLPYALQGRIAGFQSCCIQRAILTNPGAKVTAYLVFG